MGEKEEENVLQTFIEDRQPEKVRRKEGTLFETEMTRRRIN